MRYILALFACISVLFQAGYQIIIGQPDISKLPEVTIYINVNDSAGKPVTTLKQADFQVTEDGKPVEITGFAGMGDTRPVDIVFVFDTTESMTGEINGVIETCVRFADALSSQGRDYRLGLLTFGDAVRDTFNKDGSLTADVNQFKGWVQSLVANAGAEIPENSFGALKAATQMKFRADSQIIFILITDAPPHVTGDPAEPEGGFSDPDLNLEKVQELLEKPRPVTVYSVTVDDPNFRQIADKTGGTFYDVENNPDFTGIIDQISQVIATQYRITYKTPRPVNDGTRRNIVVQVGESTGTGKYVEQHMINIQSDILIGLACLFPMLFALVVPFAWKAIKGRGRPGTVQPLPVPPGDLVPPGYGPFPPQPGAAQPPYGPAPTGTVPARPAFAPPQGNMPPTYQPQAGVQQRGPARTAGGPPLTPTAGPAPAGGPSFGQPPASAQFQPTVVAGPAAPGGPPPTAAPMPGQPAPAQPDSSAAAQACAFCGAPMRPGAKFCAKCGKSQPVAQPATPPPAQAAAPRFCTNCGSPMRPGAKFCARCGHTMAG